MAADERDLIGVRTDIRRERLFLYRVSATPEEKRQLFLSYLGRIASLIETPEFYNTLVNNYTTNVVLWAKAAGGIPWPIHRVISRKHDVSQRHQPAAGIANVPGTVQSILNTLATQVLVLDHNGAVFAMNAAWQANATPTLPMGTNYLAECDAGSAGNPVSGEIANGLRELFRGARDEFRIDYSLGERWFQLRDDARHERWPFSGVAMRRHNPGSPLQRGAAPTPPKINSYP